MLTIVSRMLVGELNKRARRKPTRPVTLTGRSPLGNEFPSNEGSLAHAPMLRPIRQL